MFKERLRRIPIFRSKNHRKLTWSLQPMFFWLQILGIPAGRPPLTSVVQRYVVLLLGIFLMIWVVSALCYQMFCASTKDRGDDTQPERWIAILYTFNNSLGGILVSLNLVLIYHFNWKSLWKNACEIEQRIKFTETSYNNLRKMSTSVLMLLSMEIILPILKCYYLDTLNLPLTAMILEIGYWVSSLYPSTAVVSFICLASTASIMLQRLVDELPTNLIPFQTELNQQLIKWKRDYRSVSNYIEKINHFYGFILLTFLAMLLINLVSYIFFLIKFVQQGNSAFEKALAFLIIKNLVYALFLILICHRIKQKVLKAGQQLRKLHFSDNTVQCQINFLVIDMNLNCPKISAMGAFEIGPHLFPSFIGGVLTYLIILCQFQVQSSV